MAVKSFGKHYSFLDRRSLGSASSLYYSVLDLIIRAEAKGPRKVYVRLGDDKGLNSCHYVLALALALPLGACFLSKWDFAS